MSEPTSRWGAASDLSRVLPEGTAQPVAQSPAPEPTTPEGTGRLAGFAVTTPPAPRPRPTSGLRLSPAGRVLVGVAIAAAVAFMVWNAWQNVASL